MSLTENEINLSAMPTPNPNTIKFLPSVQFFESGTLDIPSKEEAHKSILAQALYNIENIEGVMIGFNFISVTKADEANWEGLVELIRDCIKSVLQEHGINIVDERFLEEIVSFEADNKEIAEKIKVVIDTEIRPAVAMDGGDILFKSFKEGIVTLQLQGACSSCPASTMTLKMGIENRLKEEFPEVLEVQQEL